MSSKELPSSVDCAAYDPGQNFLLGLEKPVGSDGEDNGLLEAGYCFHPKLVKPGQEGAFCVVLYEKKSCPLQVSNSSPEAQKLRDKIEENRKAREPKTIEEIF